MQEILPEHVMEGTVSDCREAEPDDCVRLPPTVRPERVPTEVSELVVTPVPSVVELRTSVLLTLYVCPDATLRPEARVPTVVILGWDAVMRLPVILPEHVILPPTVRPERVPTEVSELVVTPVPNVVELRTSVLLTLYV